MEFTVYLPDLFGGDTGNDGVETHVSEPTEPIDVRKNRQLTLDNMKLHRELEKLKQSAIALDDRMDWHNYFSALCILVSTRSSCNRLHVGCVIVKDNRIISCGYNGFLKGIYYAKYNSGG